MNSLNNIGTFPHLSFEVDSKHVLNKSFAEILSQLCNQEFSLGKNFTVDNSIDSLVF